jgi:hypothetical protein
MMTRSSIVAICLAFVMALTGQSMAVARGASDATDQMVLCIGTQSVVVYTDKAGEPTQAPHFCPDCTMMALTPVSSDKINAPLHTVIIPFTSTAYIAAKADVEPHAYLSRAPPSLI